MKADASKGLAGLLGAAPRDATPSRIRRRLAERILGAYLLITGCFYFGLWLGHYAESFSAATYHLGEMTLLAPASFDPGHSPGGASGSFALSPHLAVDAVRGCLDDENCRIYFHHLPKTGGTDIEHKFRNLLGLKKMCSQCIGGILKRFSKNRRRYCELKFSSYQLSGGDFIDVVRQCKTVLGTSQRAIALTTYREPIQRTISHIHQICNKNRDRRDELTLKACANCDYEADTAYWNTFIDQSVNTLMGVHQVVKTMNTENVPAFYVDLNDIDAFFRGVSRDANVTNARKNQEALRHCNFRAPSSMIKRHAEASAMYRNLTLGRDVYAT